ncbi:MAG TPA: sigma-70 family RNA polymerase sigma factor [Myxococcota bacterium]|nr:sigma-70 family RNA polymerase sigma factor [Myxococcota bacterium]
MINNPELLESYRKGEKSAFLALYNKYSSPIRKFLQGGFSFSSQGRICRFRGVDASMDLEAIVQETFARAFVATTRKNYDGTRPFQTYLFSIAKNLVLRECHHRDRLINVEHVEDAVETSTNYPFCSRDPSNNSPEIHLQNLQLKKLTEEFISGLNDEERMFFSWRFAKGHTQEGTAAKMDTTRARIKLLEKNMRKRFLDTLRKNGYLIEHRINPRWKRKAPSLAKAA